ncbi:MAG: alpha/beta fold hydrolase [Eubacteriales bacterium]|nr:alpha/beta fold hydrolase [Eubacteriales bacterium]
MYRYFEINKNGHNIRCKLYYSDLRNIRRVVVFCHGFSGHKDNSAAEKFAERMLSKYKGTAMITFNLPCHGDDVKKKLCLSDCITYLDLVIGYAREQYQPEVMYAYTSSFGGYLILKYLLEHGNPFRKIVMRCPAVNMYEVVTNNVLTPGDMEKLQKGKEVPVGFDRKITIGLPFLEELRIGRIHELDFLEYAEDILIIHGKADEVVPFESSHIFADNNLIECIGVEGADHRFRDPKKMNLAIKHILDFFAL